MNINPFHHRIDSAPKGNEPRVSAPKGSQRSSSAGSSQGTAGEESLKLDPLPSDLEALANNLRQFPEVREDKVDEITKRLEAGEFDSPEAIEEIAEAFLQSLDDNDSI